MRFFLFSPERTSGQHFSRFENTIPNRYIDTGMLKIRSQILRMISERSFPNTVPMMSDIIFENAGSALESSAVTIAAGTKAMTIPSRT